MAEVPRLPAEWHISNLRQSDNQVSLVLSAFGDGIRHNFSLFLAYFVQLPTYGRLYLRILYQVRRGPGFPAASHVHRSET
jgi:hypothetical protein